MTLAPFVQIVARSKGRARAMTMDEAQQAMALILTGDAAPEAVGALLRVMRLRGETADEIAGFTAALRAHVAGTLPKADLDWLSYAAGRSRGAPLFLLAARLVGQAGYTVSMHGWNSYQSATASARKAIDLAGPNVTYCPLETLGSGPISPASPVYRIFSMTRNICAEIVVLFQSDVTQIRGKIRQTRRAAISLHFSVPDRLTIEPLWPARSKPLIFCEIAAGDPGLMGPYPKS